MLMGSANHCHQKKVFIRFLKLNVTVKCALLTELLNDFKLMRVKLLEANDHHLQICKPLRAMSNLDLVANRPQSSRGTLIAALNSGSKRDDHVHKLMYVFCFSCLHFHADFLFPQHSSHVRLHQKGHGARQSGRFQAHGAHGQAGAAYRLARHSDLYDQQRNRLPTYNTIILAEALKLKRNGN